MALYRTKLAKDPTEKIFSASTTLAVPPTPSDAYAEIFPAGKSVELPPLRPEMKNIIYLKDHNLVVKSRPMKFNLTFQNQFYTKLRQEEASGRVYKSSNPAACAMCMLPNIDKLNDRRFLHDLET